MHEAAMHEENCFVTLTYRPEALPAGGTLQPKDLQDFLKRLRRTRPPRTVSYFSCGEYGEELGRPHYHGILFGVDFADKKRWKEDNGQTLYVSETLDKLWTHGHCSLGAVTFESAAYVARYTMKKINGALKEAHYTRITEDGEIIELEQEFARMSLKPAIGRRWIERYADEVYPRDEVIARAIPMKPPRYYDKVLEEIAPEGMKRIKLARVVASSTSEQKRERSPERLAVREKVKAAQVKTNLRRKLT